MMRTAALIVAAAATVGAVTAPVAQSEEPAGPAKPVTVSARAIQPGEVVMLTITTPPQSATPVVRAFDRVWMPYRVSDTTWRVLIGIDLDRVPGSYVANVSTKGFAASQRLMVRAKAFVTRKLTVDEAYVNPPANVQARIAEEAARLSKLWETTTPVRMWIEPFTPPVPEPPNSAFGSRSVFNGESRSPHGGADFPSPAGESIKAPSSGRAVLAENLYFSGNTVILDHGLGLYSLFAHLSSIAVRTGERVAAGETVGQVGATGRVTGPHLHWAIRLGTARVDPMSLLAVLGPAKVSR